MNYMRELPNYYLDACPIIDQKYRVVFKLGFGRFSKVKMGINLQTNERVAIKIMNQKIGEAELERGYEQKVLEMFLNEVKMSFEAKHRNIVEIIDFNVGGTYRTADGRVLRILYYVMKIEEYGQLFRIINQSQQFSQKTARYIFRQLMLAVKHLHNRRIAHCDIKTENVLLDANLNIKIVDFGYARYFVNEKCEKIIYDACDGVGSVKSNAPQVTGTAGKGQYCADQIDIFACGCFLFELVMKSQPFKSADIKDQHYKKIVNPDTKYFWDIFNSKQNPTTQFKDLIEKMFNPNPKERITLNSVFQHPWVKGEMMTKDQYKKQMNCRIKKIMVKIRKQQESQMKGMLLKQKGKKQFQKIQDIPINIKRQYQDQILQLKNLIHLNDSSHSDCSSIDQEHQNSSLPKILYQKIKGNGKEKSNSSQRENRELH